MIRTSLISIAAVLALSALTLSAAAGADKKKPGKQSVTIDNMKFSPESVQVNVGDTVEWTNNDVQDHTVAAKDGSFKSGNLSRGDSYRYTFKKAGKFGYGCSLHPRMKGTVVVADE